MFPIDMLRMRSASNTAFSPLSIASLAAWYDFSDLSTVFQDAAGTTPAGNGNPLGLIRDKSGNNRHLQSTSTSRPTLTLSAVPGIYYADFDGVNDAMQSVTTADPCATVITAATVVGDSDSFCGLATNATDQATNVDFIFTRNAATSNWSIGQSAGGGLSDSTHIWNNQVQSAAITTSTNRIYSADGTSHPGTLNLPGGLRIGNDRLIAGRDMHGRIYAMLLFSSILSGTDRSAVEVWLANAKSITL